MEISPASAAAYARHPARGTPSDALQVGNRGTLGPDLASELVAALVSKLSIADARDPFVTFTEVSVQSLLHGPS